MRCPKCYGKLEKTTQICTKCGFKNDTVKGASNKQAKEMIRTGNGDLVIHTPILPSDLSKKNLALWCGFLGIFGAHYFYIGKMFRGLTNLICSVFALAFLILRVSNIFAIGILQYIEFFIMFDFVFVVVNTVFDFINILLNKFKVPVYIEEAKK